MESVYNQCGRVLNRMGCAVMDTSSIVGKDSCIAGLQL
jgi:hypothetical protein